jgi:hypothetical protein
MNFLRPITPSSLTLDNAEMFAFMPPFCVEQTKHRVKGGSQNQWPQDLRIQELPLAESAPVGDITGFAPKFEKDDWKHYDVKMNMKDVNTAGLAVVMTTA